eukprot:4153332-Lingulodinium_polyedra.AAC.1
MVGEGGRGQYAVDPHATLRRVQILGIMNEFKLFSPIIFKLRFNGGSNSLIGLGGWQKGSAGAHLGV